MFMCSEISTIKVGILAIRLTSVEELLSIKAVRVEEPPNLKMVGNSFTMKHIEIRQMPLEEKNSSKEDLAEHI